MTSNSYSFFSNSNHKNQRQLDSILFYWKVRIRRHRTKISYILLLFIIVLLYIFGIFTRLLELDYERNFTYPIHSTNFRYLIEAMKSGLKSLEFIKPLNNFTFVYEHNPDWKCKTTKSFPPDPITLLIVVKSAVCNYHFRSAIRNTWGYESRFADVNIRTVFVLGLCPPINDNKNSMQSQCPIRPKSQILSTKSTSWLQSLSSPVNESYDCASLIELEHKTFNDLVQIQFIDSYYNNTLKTISSLHWVTTHCSNVPFILFVDDDYYVSVKNLLKYTRNFLHHVSNDDDDDGSEERVQFDGRLYMGYVFPNSRPMRHWTSKWYIKLDDYPFSRYPPYVTGGCFLVNNRTLTDLYYASLYTKRFKFDDVYLGILAKKMEINLIHNEQIHFHKLTGDYFNVIASHGFDMDPDEMIKLWNEQKTRGQA